MYIEFLILIFDYFRTLNKRYVIYEIVIPAFIAVFIFYILFVNNQITACSAFRESSLTLLGVLVGFSITIITILSTSHSRNLEEIKTVKTDVKIGNETISLFRLLIINFTYSVVIEIFLIIVNLIYPLFSNNFEISHVTKYIGFSIDVFLIIHVLLLTIRNMTDFYFILTKNK